MRIGSSIEDHDKMPSIMNHLVIVLLIAFLHQGQCHQVDKRSIFSWRSETKDADPAPSGYLPILQVHKYNGIQIQPIQGSPVYLPNVPAGDSSFEGQTAQLTPEQIQQLNLLNRLAAYLPEENQLQDFDVSAILPYADLISEDSLDKIRFAVESTKTKEKSKLLKFLSFFKYLKEKKLKPFKFAASVGSKIVHKKKEKVAWLLGATPSTTPTPEPVTETPVTSYPYHYAYNPYFLPNKQFYNTFSTVAPQPLQAQFAGYPYQPQFQSNFQFNQQPRIPSNAESQQYPAAPVQPAAPQYQANLASPAPQYSQFQANLQFQEVPQSSSQYQFNTAQGSDLPTFPNNLYQSQYQPQYQASPAPSADPSQNEITYEYKQTPASTFAAQDNASIRQFVGTSNNSDLPQYTAASSTPQPQPKDESAAQHYYSLPSNFILPFNAPQRPVVIPRFNRQPQSIKSRQEPNKFYITPAHTSLPNDLTPSGSENIEKIDERVELDKGEQSESLRITSEVPTSTEITFSKSKQTAGKRTVLRTVTPKSPVYSPTSGDESSKGDENKSSSVTNAPAN